MNLGHAIKERAQEVLAQLEALPEDERGDMHDLAVQAAKEAKRLALRNQMAASVQLGEAQAGLLPHKK